jgi:hypothetical protein
MTKSTLASAAWRRTPSDLVAAPPSPDADRPKETHQPFRAGRLLVAILTYTVAAVASLSGFSSRGAVLIVAAATAVLVGWNLWRSLYRDPSSRIGDIAIHIGALFWFLLPGLATAVSRQQFTQRMPAISIGPRDALLAYLAVASFYLAYVIAYGLRPSRLLRSATSAIHGGGVDVTNRQAVRIMLGLYVVGMSFFVVSAGGPAAALRYALVSRGGPKPWASDTNFGTGLTPFANFSVSLLVVVAATSGALLVTRRLAFRHRVVLAGLSIACIGWIAVDRGTRSTVLGCVLAPGLLYLIKVRNTSGMRRISRVAALCGVVLTLMVVGNAQRAYRSQLTRANASDIQLGVQDNDYLSVTAFAIAIQRAEHRYLLQPTPVVLAAGPVPRVLWKSKPIPESIALYTQYARQQSYVKKGGNNLPSIVGGEYLNWGWPGVLILGLTLGLILRAGDSFFAQASSTLGQCSYLAVVAYLFISFRGLSFGYFFPVLIYVAGARALRAVSGGRDRTEVAFA